MPRLVASTGSRTGTRSRTRACLPVAPAMTSPRLPALRTGGKGTSRHGTASSGTGGLLCTATGRTILALKAGAPLGAVGPLIGARTAPVLLLCRTRPRRRFRLRSGRNWPVLDSLLGAAPALGTALLARALAGPRVLNRSRTSLPLPCRGSLLTVLFHLNALLRRRRSPRRSPSRGQRAQQDNVGQSVSACLPQRKGGKAQEAGKTQRQLRGAQNHPAKPDEASERSIRKKHPQDEPPPAGHARRPAVMARQKQDWSHDPGFRAGFRHFSKRLRSFIHRRAAVSFFCLSPVDPPPPSRYKPPHRSATKRRPPRRRLLGNRLTVDPRTLTPLVLVRIQVPQPTAHQVFDIIDKIAVSTLRFVSFHPTDAQNWSPDVMPKRTLRLKDIGLWLAGMTFKTSCAVETSGTGAPAPRCLYRSPIQ